MPLLFSLPDSSDIELDPSVEQPGLDDLRVGRGPGLGVDRGAELVRGGGLRVDQGEGGQGVRDHWHGGRGQSGV